LRRERERDLDIAGRTLMDEVKDSIEKRINHWNIFFCEKW
jgi:hypothetical protein